MRRPSELHVAFVSEFDPASLGDYYGTPFHMVDALRAHVERVSVVAPLPRRPALPDLARKARHRLGGRGYLLQHTRAVAEGYARAAEPALRRLRPDVVLSPGSIPCTYLDTSAPIAFWPDATFESNLHFYADYTGLADENVLEGHRMEREALDRAALALYATEHAARSATSYYGAPADKVRVVRYGGNLTPVPDRAWVEGRVAARPPGPYRLLYVGGDWVRKGGDIAVRVAEEMTGLGFPTELVVVGATPQLWRGSSCVRAEGFLRKTDAAQRERLYELFASSHFLCMPVRAEAYGCVFAEAAAFGLPALTTEIGGMPTTGADGESGMLFPPQSGPLRIAERAVALLRDHRAYEALCLTARSRFERLLNWPTVTGEVAGLLAGLVR